jgi:hypothetical protein
MTRTIRFTGPVPTTAAITAACLASVAVAVFAPAPTQAATPGRTEFQILMNGDPVGRHAVSVTETGNQTSVNVAIDMAGRIGPIRFTYSHRCEETWRAGALQQMNCTDARGNDRKSVVARLAGAVLQINGTGFRGTAPAATLPSSWWNAGIVRQSSIVDTTDGRILRVTASRVREEQVATASGSVAATHWRIRGGVQKDIWFDSVGRWVKSSFRLAGQTFEYRLTTPVSGAPRA